MHRLAIWIQAALVPALGPFGLMLIALLDASFLTLPEVVDLLVVSSAAARPNTAWIAVVMATAGSVGGCVALWWIGRRGGEALLERRFGPALCNRAKEGYRRHGVFMLALPAMSPPPAPFKLFALAGGVFAYPLGQYVLVVALARGVRFTVWALLGAVYGHHAVDLLRSLDGRMARHGVTIAIGSSALVIATMGMVWILRRRRRDEAVALAMAASSDSATMAS
jgi:membrane protein YqaA with SNARE-associated domain